MRLNWFRIDRNDRNDVSVYEAHEMSYMSSIVNVSHISFSFIVSISQHRASLTLTQATTSNFDKKHTVHMQEIISKDYPFTFNKDDDDKDYLEKLNALLEKIENEYLIPEEEKE